MGLGSPQSPPGSSKSSVSTATTVIVDNIGANPSASELSSPPVPGASSLEQSAAAAAGWTGPQSTGEWLAAVRKTVHFGTFACLRIAFNFTTGLFIYFRRIAV